MRSNGYISSETFTGHPQDYLLTNDFFIDSYDPYIYKNAQTFGIFRFYFTEVALYVNEAHLVSENDFHHNYCVKGCAYSASGNKAQQIVFELNTYAYHVAQSGGAVFDAEYNFDLKDNGKVLMLQFFKSESITNTVGGAI